MFFSKVAEYFKQIDRTQSRLEITDLLSSLFKELSVSEIQPTLYLLQGRVAPLYEKVEFGMGEKIILKSLSLALSLDSSYLNKEYKRVGDLGQVVENFKKQITSFDRRDLQVIEVYRELKKMALASGTGSQETKIKILASLIRQLDPLSCKYLIRIPLGNLRLGFSDMTVLDAFSWMIKGDKSLRPTIERAYHLRPDLGYLGFLIKKSGVDELQNVRPEIFTPILMMRAERLSSAKEIIKKIGKCIVEPKFDGFRLQVHYSKKDKRVRLFSRNLEDVTHMYPDIVRGVIKEVVADEVILEGEAIGFDVDTETFLPFQATVQRRRKYDVEEKAKEIPLKLFVFELLYLNGDDYTNKPFKERRRALETVIKSSINVAKSTIFKTKEIITDDPKKLELEFEESVADGLEGIVAKKIDGVYQPGARGWNWIKFKRSYSSKLEDTIDVLVMGYDYGKGKRTGFGIGAFLVGVYDRKNDSFKTVAKVGTGLTDDEWKKMVKKCRMFQTKTKPAIYEVDKQVIPDVWIKPSIVVEILADEVSRSPVHTAGRKMRATKSGQGLEVDVPGFALRFPRLQRFRNDKRPEDVTTLTELQEMFREQKK